MSETRMKKNLKYTGMLYVPRVCAVALLFFVWTGLRSWADAFEVWTLADLQQIGSGADGWGLDASYTLMTNIDATATATWNGNTGFDPIGQDWGLSFKGSFNGNGHVIFGLTVKRSDQGWTGLFGVVGAGGVISNLCLAGPTINGEGKVGGIAGENQGVIVQCSVAGTISGGSAVGGIVGWNDSGAVLNQCIAAGTVSGDSNVGGLVGDNYLGTILKSYAVAAVTGAEYTGGLVGSDYLGTIGNNVYWDEQTSGHIYSAGGGTALLTAQMKQAGNFAGWDFEQIWGIKSGLSYPFLRAQMVDGTNFLLAATHSGPGSVVVDPQQTGYAPGAVVTITAQPDIGVSEFMHWTGGGSQQTQAVTTVVMDGHKSVTAVFRSVRGIADIVELQKIGVDPDYTLNGRYWLTEPIWASATAAWSGGFTPIGTLTAPFTGSFDGRSNLIARLTIDRPGQDDVGLFGVLGPGADIHDVGLVHVTISGNGYVGALAGYSEAASIVRCFAHAAVSGSYNNYAGGLVGYNEGGRVESSFAVGTVVGQASVGGLIGFNSDGGVVTQAYAACGVSGTSIGIGGLIGAGYGEVTSSYWDMDASGVTSSMGGTGLTTAAMQESDSYTGWDFAENWRFNEGGGYPFLSGMQWVSIVTFDADDGTVEPETAEVSFGGYYATLPEPVRTGYLWQGWWLDAVGTGTQITNGADVTVIEDHTLFGSWRADAFVVAGSDSEVEGYGITQAVQASTNHCGDNGTSICLGGIDKIQDGETAGITWSATGPGQLLFCWKVSSEAEWDVLRFYEAGSDTTNTISGIMESWEQVFYTVGGTSETMHTFDWEYEKDPVGYYVGLDCGWVDALRWIPFHTLEIVNGSGGGVYSNGTVVVIEADASPVYHVFDQWVGDTNCVADVLAATTTVVTTESDISLTAMYRSVGFPLTVLNGSGSGLYPHGTQVVIGANMSESKRFVCWTGDVATVADQYAVTTTVTTLDTSVCVAATYQVPLTVIDGAGSGWYIEGATVDVVADPDPLWMEFDVWTDDAAGLLTDQTARKTTLDIPTRPATLTATYRDSIARVAGCYGRIFTQSGIANGVSTDTASGSPSGTPAVKLGGPGVVPDNGFTAFETEVWGNGTVTFWWKVSSESNDYLQFYVDGVLIVAISGTREPWQQVTHEISGANEDHTLRWEYIKNGSYVSDQDAGWVDDIVWLGDTVQPLLSPQIIELVVTNSIFSLDFLGERGIPYCVQTNALLSSGTWGGFALTPAYISETNGLHLFESSGSLPQAVGQRFFRIITGDTE